MNGARIIPPDRLQARWDFIDLDAMLAQDHRARIVLSFVESLDLSALYDAIKSREGHAGHPSADPAVLLALWLYATVEGVGSSRELARLAERDLAYRWLAGGVPLNYHGLADFRVDHAEVLDRLLTESVTALVAEGLVSLDEIAVDGTKVRANASRESFKTGTKLMRIEAAVQARLVGLKNELQSDPAGPSRRKQAARERALRQTKERAQAALAALDRIKAEKAKRSKTHSTDEAKKSEAKASLSDAEARSMRFADGAIRPAYNAQVAAAHQQGIIISVQMTDRRNDSGLAMPMMDDMVRRYGHTPGMLLVDTHYATAEDIAALAAHEAGPVTIFAPPPVERTDVIPETLRNRKSKRAHEPDSIKEWRARMETAAGQTIYRSRKLIERINAHLKNHGFGFMPVRGMIKVQTVALMHALANNCMAAHRLRSAAA